MPSFSATSLQKLGTCHSQIQMVFNKVIRGFNCVILEGYRDEERQNFLNDTGKSQLRYPISKHNKVPSLAVDAMPYPVDWSDRERITLFAGYVLGSADRMGISICWGGDWDHDRQVKDNNFDDLVHFELNMAENIK